MKYGKAAPPAPLPPIILSNVPGTWAYDTMSRRVRENILMRVYEENDLSGPEMADAKAEDEDPERLVFSARFACPVSGFTIDEIEPRLFSFNNPAGA